MRNNRKGFTLIELVMVIVVLGVLGAVAIPFFVNLGQDAEKGVAKQFGGALKTAYTNYMLRLVVEKADPNIFSFLEFVAFGENGSARNTITINRSIRDILVNPAGDVVSNGYKTITLVFKRGTTAVYTFDPVTKAISEQITP